MRTALTLGAFAVAALIAWPLEGPVWALAIFAVGLAAALLRHLLNLRALVAWLRDPLAAPVPIGSGVWEQVFSQLYRLMRTTTQHQHRLTAGVVPEKALASPHRNRLTGYFHQLQDRDAEVVDHDAIDP